MTGGGQRSEFWSGDESRACEVLSAPKAPKLCATITHACVFVAKSEYQNIKLDDDRTREVWWYVKNKTHVSCSKNEGLSCPRRIALGEIEIRSFGIQLYLFQVKSTLMH